MLALVLFALSLAFRITEVDSMVNVDMFHLWSRRITRFMVHLSAANFAETYQTHHPGVMFMWFAGLVWKSSGVLTDPLDPEKLRLAVMPVAIVGSLFPAVTYVLTQGVLGRGHRVSAFLIGALLATEPLFVAHSRNAHLDMLVTAFAWPSVLAACIAKRTLSYKWAASSGILLGLALLTKLSSAGLALGIAAMYLMPTSPSARDQRQAFRSLVVIAATSAIVFVLLWPALWVAPLQTLARLWDGLNHEVDKTAQFMLFGQTGRLRLPFWIYGLFLVHLVTPEFWIPAVFGVARVKSSDQKVREFVSDIVIVALPLIIMLAVSSRIGTRYMIPVLPMVGTLTALGITGIYQRVAASYQARWLHAASAAIALLLVLLRVARVVSLHPLPIVYCSGWTGVDCASVFHIGWGEGLKEASGIVATHAQLRGYAEPPRVYGSGYASTMRMWTPISATNTIEEAQYLVEYLPDRQRRISQSLAIEQTVRDRQLPLLGEVKMQGRTYVRIFAGPSN